MRPLPLLMLVFILFSALPFAIEKVCELLYFEPVRLKQIITISE